MVARGILYEKTLTTFRTQDSPQVRRASTTGCDDGTHVAFLSRAVWISPVSQNYYGPRTAYGDAYHGYWIADCTQLNDKFGTADDLKALSDELHKRNMCVGLLSPCQTKSDLVTCRLLMVDVVVNDVMATSLTPDLSTYMFKDWVCSICFSFEIFSLIILVTISHVLPR